MDGKKVASLRKRAAKVDILENELEALKKSAEEAEVAKQQAVEVSTLFAEGTSTRSHVPRLTLIGHCQK